MKLKRIPLYLKNLQKIARLSWHDKKAVAIIRQVRTDKLTYLEPAALVDLYERAQQVEQQGLTGMMIEAGCALGGSAIVLVAGKHSDRPLNLYDTFEMIPSPSIQDGKDAHRRYEVITSGQAAGIKGSTYYGYQENLLQQVKDTFVRYGFQSDEQRLQFIKGFYEETLIIDQPVVLAHIDCDWYDSVMTCLRRIEPYLVSGGVLVIDDYEDWSGCRKAVDDYFADRQAEFLFEMKSRLHIIRR